jgi:hypothetical protein
MHHPSTPLCPGYVRQIEIGIMLHTLRSKPSQPVSQESAGLSRRMEIKREWNLLILTSLARTRVQGTVR